MKESILREVKHDRYIIRYLFKSSINPFISLPFSPPFYFFDKRIINLVENSKFAQKEIIKAYMLK